MTVPSTTRRAGPFTGTGALVSYPFTFKVFAKQDLAVTIADSNGLETDLVLDSTFTVTLNVDQEATPGGTVNYAVGGVATALPSGYTLVVTGDGLEFEQTADLPQGGNFSPVVIENALDRIVMLLQRLWDGVRRSMRLPDTASDNVSTVLPVPTANNFIGWDSNATALRNVDPNTLATVVAFAAWQSQAFSGDGVTTQFTLSSDPGNVNNLDVIVGAVPQRNNVDFTLSGTTLTFGVAPANGLSIFCRWGQALPEGTSTLQTRLLDTANAANGDAMLGIKRTDIAGVATNLHLWMNAQVFNVKSDGGVVGDGSTDDTAAIQDVADKIAAFQNLQITAQKITKSVMYFPDGNYKVSDSIKVRGFIAIMGTGTSYTGGSVMHQTAATKNIFEFYGSTNDNRSLGVTVEGMNFEFDNSLPSDNDAFALYFPYINDIGGSVLASNSHYIRRNRCNGWHPSGKFLKMEGSNDVEISGNIVDVCSGRAIELGIAGTAAAQCSDVRIFGNGFYYCQTGIALRNVVGVTISGGNSFFVQFASDWTAIDMTAGGGTIVPGRIEGVTITGNEFSQCFNTYKLDGSCKNINIGKNSIVNQLDGYPMIVTGATDTQLINWTDDVIKVASSYTRSAVLESANCLLKNSTIEGLQIDANGVNALTGIGLERSGPTSCFGSGMTLRNNKIFGNTLKAPQICAQLMPCTAEGLVVESVQVLPTTYPTSQPVYNMNTLSLLDSVNYVIDYDVLIDKTGSNISMRTGRVQVSTLRIRNGGNPISDVTSISSVADDYNGSGGTSLPTVTFAVGTASPTVVAVTVSASGIAAPVEVTVRCRAHSFRATGNPQIKSA